MNNLQKSISISIILSFIFYGCVDKLQVKQTIDSENLHQLLGENDDFIKFTNSSISNIIVLNNMPNGEREEFLMDVENIIDDNDINQLIQLFKIKKIETKVFHWYSKTKDFLSDNYIYDEREFEEIAEEMMMSKYDVIEGGNFRTSSNQPVLSSCNILCAVSSQNYRERMLANGSVDAAALDGQVIAYWLGCFEFCEEQ